MALYRLRGASDNDYPYVYTNPLKDTVINHRDRAFVLGIQIPAELQGDLYEMREKEEKVEIGKTENRNKEESKITGKHTGIPENDHQYVDNTDKDGPGSMFSNMGDQTPLTGLKIESQSKSTSQTQKQGNAAQDDDQNDVFLGVKSSKDQYSGIITIAQRLEASIQGIEQSIDQIGQNVENQSKHIIATTTKIT